LDKVIITIIAYALPVLLFLAKNVLPVLFNDYNRQRGKWVGVLVAFIHFPLDIIIVAVSYTILKAISSINMVPGNSQKSLEAIADARTTAHLNFTFSLIMIVVLFFFVGILRRAEDAYFEKKQWAWIWRCFLGIIVASGAMVFSIKWGM
jgi:hypothetical protein